MALASVGTGGQLYYEVHGTGEPVLLVAGQAQDHMMWEAQRTALSHHFQLIVFDQRGTGRSDGFDATRTVSTRAFADDAVALLSELGVARAHVVRHSMGGKVAQWIAVDHPDRVGALVLSATTPDARADRVRRRVQSGRELHGARAANPRRPSGRGARRATRLLRRVPGRVQRHRQQLPRRAFGRGHGVLTRPCPSMVSMPRSPPARPRAPTVRSAPRGPGRPE